MTWGDLAAGNNSAMEKTKEKIKTKASTEPMRWAADGAEGSIIRGPTDEGNCFDIRMADEPDGVLAAEKIAKVLQERGVCLIQANAPVDLLAAAHEEAESLWEDGEFKAPLRVHDDRSMIEAQLWGQALTDEDKVVWIRDGESKSVKLKNALKLLSRNLADFGGGIGPLLEKDMGIQFDRLGQAMLSCYTGDKNYSLHIDNPHAGSEGSLPDNGMRLSATYFINMNWDPRSGSEGGLDLYMSSPSETPSSAQSAKKAPKMRVAPHADTLVLYLSERMAHQVIATTGKTRWFALNLWCLNGAAMQQMTKKFLAMRQAPKEDSDDD